MHPWCWKLQRRYYSVASGMLGIEEKILERSINHGRKLKGKSWTLASGVLENWGNDLVFHMSFCFQAISFEASLQVFPIFAQVVPFSFQIIPSRFKLSSFPFSFPRVLSFWSLLLRFKSFPSKVLPLSFQVTPFCFNTYVSFRSVSGP